MVSGEAALSNTKIAITLAGALDGVARAETVNDNIIR
jgi:hypothetical protein